MRCLYCGNELALLKKLTGHGEFCSEAHRQKYQEQYNRLALTRLLQAQDSPGERRPLQQSRAGMRAHPELSSAPERRQIDAPAPPLKSRQDRPDLEGFLVQQFEPALCPTELFSTEPFLAPVTACLPGATGRSPSPSTFSEFVNSTPPRAGTDAGPPVSNAVVQRNGNDPMRLLNGSGAVPLPLQEIESLPLREDSLLGLAFGAEFEDTISGVVRTLLETSDYSAIRLPADKRVNGFSSNGHAVPRSPEPVESDALAPISDKTVPWLTEADALLFEAPAPVERPAEPEPIDETVAQLTPEAETFLGETSLETRLLLEAPDGSEPEAESSVRLAHTADVLLNESPGSPIDLDAPEPTQSADAIPQDREDALEPTPVAQASEPATTHDDATQPAGALLLITDQAPEPEAAPQIGPEADAVVETEAPQTLPAIEEPVDAETDALTEAAEDATLSSDPPTEAAIPGGVAEPDEPQVLADGALAPLLPLYPAIVDDRHLPDEADSLLFENVEKPSAEVTIVSELDAPVIINLDALSRPPSIPIQVEPAEKVPVTVVVFDTEAARHLLGETTELEKPPVGEEKPPAVETADLNVDTQPSPETVEAAPAPEPLSAVEPVEAAAISETLSEAAEPFTPPPLHDQPVPLPFLEPAGFALPLQPSLQDWQPHEEDFMGPDSLGAAGMLAPETRAESEQPQPQTSSAEGPEPVPTAYNRFFDVVLNLADDTFSPVNDAEFVDPEFHVHTPALASAPLRSKVVFGPTPAAPEEQPEREFDAAPPAPVAQEPATASSSFGRTNGAAGLTTENSAAPLDSIPAPAAAGRLEQEAAAPTIPAPDQAPARPRSQPGGNKRKSDRNEPDTAASPAATATAPAPPRKPPEAPKPDIEALRLEMERIGAGGVAPSVRSRRVAVAVALVLAFILAGYLLRLAFAEKTEAKLPLSRLETYGPSLAANENDWSMDWAGQNNTAFPGRQIYIFRPSLSMSDYRIEFKGQIEAKALGWIFRAANKRNYYAMKLEMVKAGLSPRVVLSRTAVINDQETQRSQTELTMPVALDTVYAIRTDVWGSTFKTFIQGELVDTWVDDRLKTGGFGLLRDKDETAQVRSIQFYGLRLVTP